MVKLPKKSERRENRNSHYFETSRKLGERGERWLDKHLGRYFEIRPSMTNDFDRFYTTWEPSDGRPTLGGRVDHREHGRGIISQVDAAGTTLVVSFEPIPPRLSERRRSLLYPSDDYTILARNDIRVEIKTERRAHETKNAFIETVSNVSTHAPGWAYTLRFDELFHFVPQVGKVRVIPSVLIRQHVEEWRSRIGDVTARNVGNHGRSIYDTLGVPVPFAEIEPLVTRRFIVPPMPVD